MRRRSSTDGSKGVVARRCGRKAPLITPAAALFAFIALMLAGAHAPAGAQQPPTTDMRQYLDQTRELIRAGRYDEGIERMRWFHEHALEYQPSMVGVRNSFALGDWKNLGDAYPPARKALIETRDATLAKVRESPTDLRLFSDLRALN